MTHPPVRTRFAPAPTGYLHIGGARTALFNWLFARQQGGEMVLRIEDTDADRVRPELIEVIFEALTWLGIDWDGEAVYQSSRSERYADAAARLLGDEAAYWCDCTPDDVKARHEARGGKPGYDGFCRDRGLGPGPGRVARFRSPDEGATTFVDVIRGHITFEHDQLEDFVIVRSTGAPMFLLANAVDDAELGITHVIRGEDLINVTPKVLLLRKALGIEDVPVFAHLPLIVNEQRKKLSKRRDDVSVGDYRDRGYLPEAMANYLALLGWGPSDDVEVRPMAEIMDLFRLEDVNKASAFFDLKKLAHINGEYIRALPGAEFVERSRSWLVDAAPWPPERFRPDVFEAMAPLVQERVATLGEVPGYVDFLFVESPAFDPKAWEKVMVTAASHAEVMLEAAIAAYADESTPWEAEGLVAVLGELGEANEVPKKQRQAAVRLATTGRSVGPPLGESLVLLGRDEVLARLRAARALVGEPVPGGGAAAPPEVGGAGGAATGRPGDPGAGGGPVPEGPTRG